MENSLKRERWWALLFVLSATCYCFSTAVCCIGDKAAVGELLSTLSTQTSTIRGSRAAAPLLLLYYCRLLVQSAEQLQCWFVCSEELSCETWGRGQCWWMVNDTSRTSLFLPPSSLAAVAFASHLASCQLRITVHCTSILHRPSSARRSLKQGLSGRNTLCAGLPGGVASRSCD